MFIQQAVTVNIPILNSTCLDHLYIYILYLPLIYGSIDPMSLFFLKNTGVYLKYTLQNIIIFTAQIQF